MEKSIMGIVLCYMFITTSLAHITPATSPAPPPFQSPQDVCEGANNGTPPYVYDFYPGQCGDDPCASTCLDLVTSITPGAQMSLSGCDGTLCVCCYVKSSTTTPAVGSPLSFITRLIVSTTIVCTMLIA